MTNSDVTLLVRHLSGWSVDKDVNAADMNADGKLTNRDAISMIRKLNGFDDAE